MQKTLSRLRTAILATAVLAPAALAPAALAPAPLTAQVDEAATVVYLVRHAETAPDGTADPALSEAGRERAARLARMVAGAGLTAVHATPYQRTRQTAAPVAAAAGLTVREYDPGDLRGFAARLLNEGGRHLVVGHSNTTPALVQILGADPAGPISEDDYGRFYHLTLDDDGVRSVLSGYPGGFLADPPPAVDAIPEPAAADVESVESIVAALYDVISGPIGEPRDWDRMRSLFLPTARLLPVQRTPDGRVVHRALTVEDYIRGSGATLEEIGFRESEVARRVERFGDVAHVFSTYEAHRDGVAEPILRGVNSIQLIRSGGRWWIASLTWSAERPDLPIPPRYRGEGEGG